MFHVYMLASLTGHLERGSSDEPMHPMRSHSHVEATKHKWSSQTTSWWDGVVSVHQPAVDPVRWMLQLALLWHCSNILCQLVCCAPQLVANFPEKNLYAHSPVICRMDRRSSTTNVTSFFTVCHTSGRRVDQFRRIIATVRYLLCQIKTLLL